MTVDKCEFRGIKECVRLSDGNIELFVTTAFGPRIIGAGFCGGQNFFRIFDECFDRLDSGEWQIFGGHRLWHAPEAYPRTYSLDNTPVPFEVKDDVLILDCPEEKENHLKKQIAISIGNGKVRIVHTIKNTGNWEIELAAWALTVMAPCGKLIVPQEKFVPAGHGEGETLLPGRSIAIWPYTDMSDPRLVWGKDFVEMSEQGGSGEPMKFGVFNSLGFAAYELNGEYFVKRFAAYPGCAYPDFGCNCEFYTKRGMLEVESLSPLTLLAPEDEVEHVEVWEFFREKPDFL